MKILLLIILYFNNQSLKLLEVLLIYKKWVLMYMEWHTKIYIK